MVSVGESSVGRNCKVLHLVSELRGVKECGSGTQKIDEGVELAHGDIGAGGEM